jgi:hypothetical protein
VIERVCRSYWWSGNPALSLPKYILKFGIFLNVKKQKKFMPNIAGRRADALLVAIYRPGSSVQPTSCRCSRQQHVGKWGINDGRGTDRTAREHSTF